MKRLVKLAALAVAVYAVATTSGRARLKRAREAYSQEVASGAKPIEAVGTAVAAFVGLAEGGPPRNAPLPLAWCVRGGDSYAAAPHRRRRNEHRGARKRTA